MHLLTFEIQQQLRRHNVPLKDRGPLAEVLVAEAVALKLPLPSSKLQDAGAHFRTQHKVGVLEKLAKVNEEIVIDLDRTCALAMELWLMRYRLVHCPNDIRTGRFIQYAIQSDQNSTISPECKKLVRSYPDALLTRYRIEEEKELDEEPQAEGAGAYVSG